MNFLKRHENFDFVAVGDVTVDAFIKLTDAEVECDQSGKLCKLLLRFADKIAFESVEEIYGVGNSGNAAVCAARLGLKSAIATHIGADHNGTLCLAEYQRNKVSTDFVHIDSGVNTNYHFVLWFKDERTILIKHNKFNYTLPDFGEPKWIYLSSLGPHSLRYHDMLIDYLRAHPNVKLAFQPGTFQMNMEREVTSFLYGRSDIFFCNLEEAKRILKKYDVYNYSSVEDVMKQIKKLGPKIVVITDGPSGAYAFDGHEGLFMPPFPDIAPPFERTGAGDAFSATFTSAIALERSLFDALMMAPINSMSVVQHLGAQKGLLTQKDILGYLADAPHSYAPKRIF